VPANAALVAATASQAEPAETLMGDPELQAAPNINSITPNSGPPETATAVTIGGVGFTGATSVTFGGIAATNFVEVSDTQITCSTPANIGFATVDVTVATPGGNNTMFNGFKFQGGTSAGFPAFTPILPPPAVGAGGGAAPTFPPPTPPPIGHVPVGPLVGPAIAPAAVPPSVAGVVQPQYLPPPATATGTSTGTTSLTLASVTHAIVLGATITGTGVPADTEIVSQQSGTAGGAGVYTTNVATTLAGVALTITSASAILPAANDYFPQFTTTTAYAGFPNNPPAGVPIVFSNISTNPSRAGGIWTVVTPPSTPTTAQITLNGASNLTPHASDLRFGAGVLMQVDQEQNHRMRPKRRADKPRGLHL
jgi:hypothetical protein